MELKTKRIAQVLFVVSLLLAGLGQYYFAFKSDQMWDGITCYLLAMVAFGWAIVFLEGRPAPQKRGLWREFWELLHGSRARLVALIAGALVVLYVTAASRTRAYEQRSFDLLVLWVVGIGSSVGAFVDWVGLPHRLRGAWMQLRIHRLEVGLVALFALATFLFRGINQNGIPYVLSGDEASMGLEAVGVINGQRNNPFVTGWLSHPTLYFFIQAAFLRVLGINTAALRLPSALISAATVVLLYLLARRLYGRWVAILAAIFFASYHYAIHFGRLALNNIWDPFFAVGMFYFLTRALEEKRPGYAVLTGLFAGLAVYFYMGARLIPILLVVYLAYWALSERDFFRNNLLYLAITAFVAFIVALPLLSFFLSNPTEAMARWNQMGIFPSGWVNAQMQQTGRSMYSILLEQFLKSVLAFNYYTDPTFWYHPGIPLLQFVPSIFFVFGLAYAIRRSGQRSYFLLVIWYLLVIIFGGVLLENPPTSPRLVLAIPPVVLCVVLGVVKIATYVQSLFSRSRQLTAALSLALVLVFSSQSADFYFNKYTPDQSFSDLNTQVADYLGKYLHVLGPSYECYFFGAPRLYYGHATIPFLAQGVKGYDVIEPLQDRPAFVDPQYKAVFVFVPERLGELDVVRRYYPSGLLREFRGKQSEMLFVAYEATD